MNRRRGYQGPASRAVASSAARLLVERVTSADRVDDLSDYFEDHASKLQFCANLPRAEAERIARERTERRARLLSSVVRRMTP